MKFLLTAINAKFIHSNPAIYSLRAGAGEKLQPYVELAEFTINESLESILEGIWKRQPKVIGFSCYIWNWKLIREILTELPKILPDTEIWLGGPEVTYDGPGLLREFPQVTGIMVGEGEVTFREVLEQYLREAETAGQSEQQPESDSTEHQVADRRGTVAGKSMVERFGQIPGLCLASGYTAPRDLTDLTTLPFLYEDMEPFTNRIIYYETSRGCPYRCSYCLSSIDKKVRLRDISVVKRELQFFLDQNVKQVKFIDRTFNCDHKHAMEIWRYIYEHDNGVTNFHFEISADILREEEIALLNRFRPGLAQLEIGVQSTNPETIRAIHRVMDVDKLEKIVAAIHRGQNIHQHLDLIAGLPYENLESFKKSFNDVYRLRPQQFQLGFLKVLKGSKMHEKAGEYGIVYHTRPMYEVLSTNWLTYDEVIYLKGIEEMVEVYYNSCQFRCTMLALEAEFDTPFAMYEALAEYYEENGLNGLKHSRMGRFDILHDFILSYVKKEHAPKYEDDLLMDLYLREKSKSRPSWAADLSGYKSEIQKFFRKEAEEKRYLKDYEGYSWKQILNMTHVEVDSKGKWTLFDYKRRDPLTKDAKTYRILERKEEERV